MDEKRNTEKEKEREKKRERKREKEKKREREELYAKILPLKSAKQLAFTNAPGTFSAFGG